MADYRQLRLSISYPGVAQMVERVVWDHEAAGSKPVTRTKKPLKSLISEVFCYFIVYCGAFFEFDFSNQDCPSLLSTTLIMS